MRKKGVMSICAIGIIVIVLSLAAFFLMEIERNPVTMWAFISLLISEVVLFGGLIGLRLTSAQYGKVFLKVGIGTTLLLYFIATLIVVLFSGAFREKLNIFILIELSIIAVSAVIAVLIIAFAHRIERSNEEDLKKTGTTEAKRGGF